MSNPPPYRTRNEVTYYGAKLPFTPPDQKPPTAAQKAGVAYEKALHRHLRPRFGRAYRAGRWWRWDGRFYQTDAYVVRANRILLLEAKLRARRSDLKQVYTYRDLLESYYQRPVLCALVTAYVDPGEWGKSRPLDEEWMGPTEGLEVVVWDQWQLRGRIPALNWRRTGAVS